MAKGLLSLLMRESSIEIKIAAATMSTSSERPFFLAFMSPFYQKQR